ncbi:MAG: organic solvent tolerance protein [Gammaproteobacteria bacterium]|nr:MAG: organic solvent tolerance protein [Gammaproteobacteria bacterium]
MRKLIIFSAITLVHLSTTAMAGSAPQQCEFDNTGFLVVKPDLEAGVTDIQADSVQIVDEGTSIFSGDVEVLRDGQELKSQRATYNRLSGELTAQGDVQIRDSGMILNGQNAEWSLENDSGTLIDAEYRLREGHLRGKAGQVHRDGVRSTNLNDATYTSCAPGDETWLLQAANVNLDHVKQVGVARDVVVRIADIPVFYTPYISFPLTDERKSGLLVPSFGSSDKTGFDIQTPYYWNISPDKDATITPRYMSDRGLMLSGEFRYLGSQYEGKLDAGFLASDSMKKEGDALNPYYKENRKHFSWQHEGDLSSRWYTNIDYNYVSDKAYLEDFGSNLSLASTSYLDRKFELSYGADYWDFVGRLQGYQVLDNVTKPYQRLPQLRLNGSLPDQAFGLTYGLTAEYVAFDHDTKVSGQRFDLQPAVSLPLRSSSAFLTPRIALHHTQYDLDANGTSLVDSSPSRTLPISSIDSGLFFERELNFADTGYIHTLEPRAFYLYVPERDQTDIPIFDTSLRTFGMGQLFSYDRFSAADRIGDTNQLTLAVTSRIINQQTGKESLRVSLGQIHYFSDRDVSITNTKETRSNSDMVVEVIAAMSKEWTARGEMQWNTAEGTNSMSAVSVRYRGENGSLLNVSHRYRRDGELNTVTGLEQVDLSTRVPFNDKFSFVGRWYHSLSDNRTLETLAGIEYDSCCWATRVVVRDYVNSITDQDRNLGIFFQVELKGLGGFGQKTEALLDKNILGYGS